MDEDIKMPGFHISANILAEAKREHSAQVKHVSACIASINVENVRELLSSGYVHSTDIASAMRATGVQQLETHKRDALAMKLQQRVSTSIRAYIKHLHNQYRQNNIDAEALQKETHQIEHHLIGPFCERCFVQFTSPASHFNALIVAKCRTAFDQKLPTKPKTMTAGRPDTGESPLGYLYMVQTRACKNASESVFKVGKTSRTILERLHGYDKGTDIICVLPVKDKLLDTAETELLHLFQGLYIARTDYGREYFEGSKEDMAYQMMRFVFNLTPASSKTPPARSVAHCTPSTAPPARQS